MFKKYKFKKLSIAVLAVSLLASPMGAFAVQNQNQTQKQPGYTKRFLKWLFVGNTETLKKIKKVEEEITERKEKCENEIKEVVLNPNQGLHTDTKKLEKKVQELRRREASVIYKLFRRPFSNNYLKPIVEKPDFKNRAIVAVKNIIPYVSFLATGLLLRKYVNPLFKTGRILSDMKGTRFSSAVYISEWLSYGLAAIFAVRTARAPFVAVKDNLELTELQTTNSEQKQIKIREVKFDGENAPMYKNKVQNV